MFNVNGTPHKFNDYCNLATLGLKINGQNLNNVSCYKFLSLTFDNCMMWSKAIIATCKKLGTSVAMTQRLMSFFPQSYVNTIYYAFVQPYIDYGLSIWETLLNQILIKYNDYKIGCLILSPIILIMIFLARLL